MNIKIFLSRIFSFRNAKTAALALGGIAVFLFAVSYGLSWYEQWKGRHGVENLAEMLKKIEAEDYKLAMADTYGGKTPQETLQMYIDAVEKGDFELASRYFIGDKQKDELRSLQTSPKENIQNVINILKDTNSELLKKEPFWELQDNYIITEPILIRFIKYPNGIWKIIEI